MDQIQALTQVAGKEATPQSVAGKREPSTPLEPMPPSNTALFPTNTDLPQSREHVLWYDSRALAALDEESRAAVVQRLGQGRYNGIVLYADNYQTLNEAVSPRLQRVLQVDSLEE